MANEMSSDQAVQSCLEFYMKLAATTTLLLALVAAWAFFFRGRKLKLPPGPFPFPIIGNLHMLGELPHKVLTELSLKYGPLMSLRLGSALTLVVSSPEMAKEFLKTHDMIFAGRPQSTATKYLWYNSSDVVFSSYGRYWKLMRKFCVSQLLSSRRIHSFRLIRDEEVSAMIRAINSDGGGYLPVNLSKIVSAFGIDVICRMTFGKKYSDHDLIAGTRINSMIKETFILAGSFNIGDYIPYLAWMDLQGLNRRLKNIHKIQDDLLENIVEEHVSPQNNSNAMPDLVDVLLAASADEDMEFQITRDNIKSVIYDMLSAGSDASSASIEWTMSEVLKNPPVQKKLQNELERVVGLERMVQESDMPSLVYLQAVVKETLRLHPPGPLAITHSSMEDCTVLGYEIPRGTRLLLNLGAIGRNPKSWEDAESFKPERFMEAGLLDAKVQNFEWIPFGAGRRGCPAQQLGMLIVEFAVAQLLHCFNWRLPDDMNESELDMCEENHGLTVVRAHELFAVPTPRLPVL